MKTDTSEKGLESLIFAAMTGHAASASGQDGVVHEPSAPYGGTGWILGDAKSLKIGQGRLKPAWLMDLGHRSWTFRIGSKDYDRELTVDLAQLRAFLRATQPAAAEVLDLENASPTRQKFLAHFYQSLDDLDKLDWAAVAATDFRDIVVREGKQAEFLVYESFPWKLVEKVGVLDVRVVQAVEEVVSCATHSPAVSVESAWYY